MGQAKKDTVELTKLDDEWYLMHGPEWYAIFHTKKDESMHGVMYGHCTVCNKSVPESILMLAKLNGSNI